MEALQTFLQEGGPAMLAWAGLLIGTSVGLTVRLTNFCSMGALSDIHSFGDRNRFRAWMLAIAISIIGVWLLTVYAGIDFSRSIYLTPSLSWAGAVVGGFAFGVGMVFAGGCVTRNLVRVGGGDLRSIITILLTGLFAYMAMGGLLGPLRAALFAPLMTDLSASGSSTQSISDLVSAATGATSATTSNIVTFLIAALFALYALKDGRFRASRRDVTAGVVLGLLVTIGWAVTGLAYDEFAAEPAPLESLSFVRPAGDLLNYLMRYTAAPVPEFGMMTAVGVVVGGFIGALYQRGFSLTGFADRSDLVRVMAGSALMGIGGVTALGCTLGQGMSGVSTLALGSFLALGGIIVGGFVGLRLFERMLEAE